MHTFRASLSASSRLACARASCFLMSCCCNRTLSLSIWCWSCLTSFLAMSHFNDSFSSLCKTKIKKKTTYQFQNSLCNPYRCIMWSHNLTIQETKEKTVAFVHQAHTNNQIIQTAIDETFVNWHWSSWQIPPN